MKKESFSQQSRRLFVYSPPFIYSGDFLILVGIFPALSVSLLRDSSFSMSCAIALLKSVLLLFDLVETDVLSLLVSSIPTSWVFVFLDIRW